MFIGKEPGSAEKLKATEIAMPMPGVIIPLTKRIARRAGRARFKTRNQSLILSRLSVVREALAGPAAVRIEPFSKGLHASHAMVNQSLTGRRDVVPASKEKRPKNGNGGYRAKDIRLSDCLVSNGD